VQSCTVKREEKNKDWKVEAFYDFSESSLNGRVYSRCVLNKYFLSSTCSLCEKRAKIFYFQIFTIRSENVNRIFRSHIWWLLFWGENWHLPMKVTREKSTGKSLSRYTHSISIVLTMKRHLFTVNLMSMLMFLSWIYMVDLQKTKHGTFTWLAIELTL
jgi:hypothetical protein